MTIQSLFALGTAFIPFPYNIPVAVGGALLSNALQEPEKGPRLEEVPLDPSTAGAAIPIVVGRAKVHGHLIDAGPVVEHSQTESVGKGSFLGPQRTTFTYTRTLAWVLTDTAGGHPIKGVLRIWLNGQLEVDLRSGSTGPVSNNHRWKVYIGDELQTADPELVAIHGANTVSSHRGTSYVIFYDLDVTPYSGAVPILHAEVINDATTTFPKAALDTGDCDFALRFALDSQRLYVYGMGFCDPGHGLLKWDALTGALLRDLNFDFAWAKSTNASGPFVTEDGRLFTLVKPGSPFTAQLSEHDPDTLAILGSAQSGSAEVGMGWLAVDPRLISPGRYAVTIHASNTVSFWLVALTPPIHLDNVAQTTLMGGETARAATFDRDGLAWIVGTATLRAFVLIGTGPGNFVFDEVRTIDVSSLGTIQMMTYWPDAHALVLMATDGTCGVLDVVDEVFVDTFETEFSGEDNLADWQAWRYEPFVSYRGIDHTRPIRLDLVTGEETVFERSVYTWTGTDMDTAVWVDATQCLWISGGNFNSGDFVLCLPQLDPLNVTLRVALERIGELVGPAADYDFSAQTQILTGFTVGAQMKAAEAAEPLLQAYQVDQVETDFLVRGVNRGGASARTLVVDDLGAHESGEPPDMLGFEDADPAELPQRIEFRFVSEPRDYEAGMVPAEVARDATVHEETRIIEAPIVYDNEDTPRNQAMRMLLAGRANARVFDLTTASWHAELTPTDVVEAPDVDGTLHRLRLDRIERGLNGVLKFVGARERAEIYTVTVDGSVDQSLVFTSPSLAFRPPVRLFLLDIPLLRPQDDGTIGPYVAVTRRSSAGSFGGATIQRSNDGGESWIDIGGLTAEAAGGFATTALADTATPYVFDEVNTVDVTIENGLALVSKTDAELDDYANLAWLAPKASQDLGELIQFGTATPIAGDRWRLSHLLRGRLGTEPNTGLHLAGDLFVLLTTANVGSVSQPLAEVDVATLWRAVAQGQSVPTVEEIAFTNTGKRLWPYAPYAIEGARDGSDNLTVTFLARSRQTPAPFLNHPIGESAESYEMDILDAPGGTVLRTKTSATKSFSYPASEQTADGLTPGDPVTVTIYQISPTLQAVAGQTGRGYGTEETV